MGGGKGWVEAPPSDNVYVADLPEEVDEALIHSVFGNYGTVVSCKPMPSKYPGQKGAALVRFSTVEEATWLVENVNGNLAEGLIDPIQVRFANNKGERLAAKEASYGKANAHSVPQAREAREAPWRESALARAPLVPRATPWSRPSTKGAAAKTWPGQAAAGGGKGRGTVSSSDIGEFIRQLVKSQSLPGAGRKPDENCLYITGLPSNTTDHDLYRMFAPFGAIPATGVKARLGDDGLCTGVGFVDFCEPDSAQDAINTLSGMAMPDGVTLLVSQKKSKSADGAW